jgi:2-hydroxy-3-keto-5-methylthiopentenyl-1-phosphate phosphatase
MLVLCDFDGTATTADVTNVLWDRYGMPDWRRRLLPAYRAGLATTLELMDEGWRVITRPEAELIGAARSEIALRDGFLGLADLCDRLGWRLHVVSCGLDWYLKAFLPPTVAFTSYTAVLEDGWRVRLPPGCVLPTGRDFKIHVMEELRGLRGPEPTVFIGDGRNDFPVARECDRVFAVRGSTLARLCRGGGIDVVEFESFATVSEALQAAPAASRRDAPSTPDICPQE